MSVAQMMPTKIGGLLLLAGGVAALTYGGITYTNNSHSAKIGGIELSVRETHEINLPVWAGVVALFIGAGLMLVPPKN